METTATLSDVINTAVSKRHRGLKELNFYYFLGTYVHCKRGALAEQMMALFTEEMLVSIEEAWVVVKDWVT